MTMIHLPPANLVALILSNTTQRTVHRIQCPSIKICPMCAADCRKKIYIQGFHAAHWGLSMFSISHLSIHGIEFGAQAWRALVLPLGVVAIDVGHMLIWPLASSPIFYLFTPQLWPHWFQIALLLWRLISDACSDSDWSTAWEQQKASVGQLNGPAKCVLCLLSVVERIVNYGSDSVWLKLDQSSVFTAL